MITQQQEHEIQQKAKAPAPVKLHRWVVAICSILGVALPLVAGSMLYWPWGVPDFMDSQGVLITIVLAAVVSVIAGAFLLGFAFRHWWVGVFAALAWVVGEFLSWLVSRFVEGSWSSQLQAWNPFWSGQLGFILFAALPLFVCAIVGGLGAMVVLDKLAERRASRQ